MCSCIIFVVAFTVIFVTQVVLSTDRLGYKYPPQFSSSFHKMLVHGNFNVLKTTVQKIKCNSTAHTYTHEFEQSNLFGTLAKLLYSFNTYNES